jgi:iron complex outermembrane receptor protein
MLEEKLILKSLFLSMFNRTRLLLVFILLGASLLSAQNCKLKLTGVVQDEESGLPLSFVNVYIQETFTGSISDASGNFVLDKLCPGNYHLVFSHIGCDPVHVHIELKRDTLIEMKLAHNSTSLEGALVEGTKSIANNQASLSINRQAIEDNSNQNLSSLLEEESGVHLIKNGSGISKPVVNGLYGNRLTILNNGIIQSGQQWGNDHSPEIDPFSADKITVLKGVSAIAYGGGNMGSVILVEPKKIQNDPHLHGQAGYVFESNGLGNTLNFRLEKSSSILAWRVSGSLKKYGDKRTSSYFLNNSGTEEANVSIQLEKSWKEKLFLEVYGSTFNTRLGILRGSQIGNLTDLELAFTQDQPFFTEDQHSYRIEAPKQHVSHHLLKLKTSYYFSNSKWIEFILAGQLNNRKEFDVRRSGRTEIPSLSLNQLTFNAGIKYAHNFDNDWHFKAGSQLITTDNTNNPETDLLPLIPDYFSIKSGWYSSLSKDINKINLAWGFRYDYEFQNVAAISSSLPREVLKYQNNFHNVAGLFSINLEPSKTQRISFHSGYTMRNPAINERYSNGLHQGVSGIEQGDVSLKTEQAIKHTLGYKFLQGEKFSFEALTYAQYFRNYIFLNPQDEVRLTIRGAFPVFQYEQTEAIIFGLDLVSQFAIANLVHGKLKYSYLQGQDLGQNLPLVFMPPNSVFGSLAHRTKKPIVLTSKLKVEDLEFEVNNKFVFKQNNLLARQDFVPPPEAYNLLGAKISANLSTPKLRVRIFVQVDNLLNTSYRDYLNRQRYFADDLGLSFTIGTNLKF